MMSKESLFRKVSAKSVDNIACLLLHEKFEQTRDGKFLRFIIIIAPPHVSTCTKSLIIHECCRVEKENIFSLSVLIFFHPSPHFFFHSSDHLIPARNIRMSRVNVVWKMWTLCHFCILYYTYQGTFLWILKTHRFYFPFIFFCERKKWKSYNWDDFLIICMAAEILYVLE